MSGYTSKAEISHIADCAAEWIRELEQLRSLTALRKLCGRWRYLCPDAYRIAGLWKQKQFEAFRQKLSRKRDRGSDMEIDERIVLLPQIIVEVALIAARCKVPWGWAFHRMLDCKRIITKGGVLVLNRELPMKNESEVEG